MTDDQVTPAPGALPELQPLDNNREQINPPSDRTPSAPPSAQSKPQGEKERFDPMDYWGRT